MARRHPEGRLVSQDQSIDAFLSEFQQETDRAAAVLGPAMLDQLLKDLLDATFTSAEVAKELTEKMMPIGTFSARITLAQAIGAISNSEARDLHRMRKIRNDFAHQLNGLSFKSQSVRDHCGNLISIKKSQEIAANKQFFAQYPKGARSMFNLAVTLAVSQLKTRVECAKRIAPASYAAK
jgi:DNA-binding MltR family transcriptional regulator